MTPPDELDTRRTLMETVRLSYNDEDTLIERDMERFDGILGQRARRNARGMLIPLRGGGRLTVLNTNKRDLETTIGSDLIYYHADRHCGILVQYKRMKQDPDGGWTYRGDPQLAAQLRSMRALEVGKQPGTVGQYRLSTQPHYLKIVRPSDYDGQSAELMKGLYLPLDLVSLMHESAADMNHGRRQPAHHVGRRAVANSTAFEQHRLHAALPRRLDRLVRHHKRRDPKLAGATVRRRRTDHGRRYRRDIGKSQNVTARCADGAAAYPGPVTYASRSGAYPTDQGPRSRVRDEEYLRRIAEAIERIAEAVAGAVIPIRG